MFQISGGIISLYQERGLQVDKIPTGTYGLGVTPTGEFFLYTKNDMAVPSITYGDADDKSERILKTFLSRKNKNTGVLLEGTKGSGKTLQAKMLSASCAKLDIPTIVLGSPFSGEGFINFLSEITQPVMVMIDEFDKQYPEKEEQNSLLTLLDGVGGYNKLYVLTKNDGYVSEFLRNRPSRIFYNFSYKKLPRATMDDYLDRNLEDKSYLKDFNNLYELSVDLNFDVIQALTEELNRFPGDKFKDVLSIMGITVTDYVGSVPKRVTSLMIDGIEYKDQVQRDDLARMAPSRLFEGGTFEIYIATDDNIRDFPSISGLVYPSQWDNEENEWSSHVHEVRLSYDERFVKSMGSSGYHFAGEIDGHSFDIRVEEYQKEKYTNHIFG